MLGVGSALRERFLPLYPCGLCITETIQPTPNLPWSIPNFGAQKVFSSGMVTRPPSLKAVKTRSASDSDDSFRLGHNEPRYRDNRAKHGMTTVSTTSSPPNADIRDSSISRTRAVSAPDVRAVFTQAARPERTIASRLADNAAPPPTLLYVNHV